MSEYYKGKRILVLGGSGFVGVNLISAMLKAGANVRASLHHKNAIIEDERIDYHHGDLRDPQFLKGIMENTDLVFMCAANTSGAAVMDKNPLAHVTPNVVMNTQILDQAYRAGVEKILFMSSNTVYPVTDYPMREDEMVYGELFDKYYCVAWMKQFTEVLCNMYANKIKRPMKALVVRPANIYGPFDDFDWETSHVLPALIRKVVERMDPLEVWGDGKDIKDFIYVDDMIAGLMIVMEKQEIYDPVNIGSGTPNTIRQALGYLLKADGYNDANIVYNSDKPTMIPVRMLNVSKAKSLWGFETRTSLQEGLQKTIQWYRKYYNLQL